MSFLDGGLGYWRSEQSPKFGHRFFWSASIACVSLLIYSAAGAAPPLVKTLTLERTFWIKHISPPFIHRSQRQRKPFLFSAPETRRRLWLALVSCKSSNAYEWFIFSVKIDNIVIFTFSVKIDNLQTRKLQLYAKLI